MTDRLAGFTGVVLPQVMATQQHTWDYLKEHQPETLAGIDNAYSCYFVLLTLPTGLRFKSRHYYPYNLPFYEALEELESSLLLAFSGHYKTAIQHLRFMLELAFFGLYCCKPVDESWLQKWLLGQQRTPSIKYILNELGKDQHIRALNSTVGIDLRRKCYEVYDSLSAYVHTRGESVISANMRGANFPMLNPEALGIWASFLQSIIRVIAFGMVGRFTWALQGLPLFEKFGFADTPRGGFLEPFEVEAIERVFDVDTTGRLRLYSDRYYTEELRIDHEGIRQTPNLTLEELKASLDKWWGMLKQLDKGYIPGKTWDTYFASPQNQESSELTLETARTPSEFVRVATYLRREMDNNDELMLAQAYTENLINSLGES